MVYEKAEMFIIKSVEKPHNYEVSSVFLVYGTSRKDSAENLVDVKHSIVSSLFNSYLSVEYEMTNRSKYSNKIECLLLVKQMFRHIWQVFEGSKSDRGILLNV